MECFSHPDAAAVGLCKSCGKGVCRSCAIEVERGLACSEACRPVAQALSAMQQASLRNVGILTTQRIFQPLMAAVFLLFGAMWLGSGGFLPWFLICTGVVMGISALASMSGRAGKSTPRNDLR